MKDEVKEILDILKDSATNPIVYVPVLGGVSVPIDNDKCLEPNECKILLDYITNLQEEINRFNNIKNKSLYLLNHNDIMDYRVFENHLFNILTGGDNNV